MTRNPARGAARLGVWRAASLAGLLAGCSTSLHVASEKRDVEKLYPKEGPPRGVVYYLPEALVEFEITRTLTSCPKIDAEEEVAFAVDAEIRERYRPDRARPYVIDYAKLERGLKEISLTVDLYEDQTLQSLNATVTDKTADVFAGVLQGAAKIAGIVIRGGGAKEGGALSPDKDGTVCKPDAVKALGHVKDAKQKIKTRNAEIDDILANEPRTDKDKERIRTLRDEIEQQRERLAGNLRRISWTEDETWPPEEVKSRPPKTFAPDRAKLDGMLDETPDELVTKLTVEARLEIVEAADHLPDRAKNPGGHLIYRAPAPATVYVCQESCGGESILTDALIAERRFDVPQAGVHVALPLKNKLFDGQTLSASFEKSGALKQFKYLSKAELAAAAEAFSKTAQTADEIATKAQSNDLEDLKAATALLQAETAYIKAKGELEALKSDNE